MTTKDIILTAEKSTASGGFISQLASSAVDNGYGICVDSLNNVYIIGSTAGLTANIIISKYDAKGVIQWQKIIDNSAADNGYGITVDSSDNLYITGSITQDTIDFFTAKLSTTGIIQWQKYLDSTGNDVGRNITVTPTGDICVVGYEGFNAGILVVKYNSAGLLLWQKNLKSTGTHQGYGIITDSSENIYLTGVVNETSDEAVIIKLDSFGNLQWQKKLGGIYGEIGRSIAVDSLGNSYITFADSNNYLVLAKYNSSGTLQWQRAFTGSYNMGQGVSIDNNNYIYVIGSTNAFSGTGKILIAKYNTSGTLQWQRTLSGGAGDNFGYAIICKDLNIFIVGTSTTTTRDILLAKLPNNGTLAGAYLIGSSTYTYAVSTVTESASSLTSGTSSLTILRSGPSTWLARIFSASSAEQAYSVITDSAGSIYLTGVSNSDIYITKLNPEGTSQIWQKSFVVVGSDSGKCLTKDSSDNIYLVSNLGGVIYLTKFDTTGTVIFNKSLSGSYTPTGVKIDSLGNIYCLGFGVTTDTNDIIIIKLDSNGSILWQKFINKATTDQGYGLDIDNSGNIYICGVQYNSTADAFIAKISSAGDFIWQKIIDNTSSDFAYSIKVDLAGNSYIAGRFFNSTSSSFAHFIAKYDTLGVFQWYKWVSGVDCDAMNIVTIDDLSNIYVIGKTAGANWQGVILKYSNIGQLLSSSKLSCATGDIALYGINWFKGVLTVCGYTTAVASNQDIFIAQLSDNLGGAGTFALSGATIVYSTEAFTTADKTNNSSASTASISNLTSTVSTGATSPSNITLSRANTNLTPGIVEGNATASISNGTLISTTVTF